MEQFASNSIQHTNWSLASLFGFEHPFFTLNKLTIVNTWIVLGIILVSTILIRIMLKSHEDKLSKPVFTLITAGDTLMSMSSQALGSFSFNHFSFVATLFIFILLCNTITVIPWLEEPTVDLNTTIGLSALVFLYIQATALIKRGPIAYVKSYFAPFFLLMPLNIIGKLSTVLSMSFRLFGNIFSGSIISSLLIVTVQKSLFLEIISLVTGINLIVTIFFILFEGALQAFVFTMLSLTYLSLALRGEGH